MSIKKTTFSSDESKCNRLHRGSIETISHVRNLLRDPSCIVYSFGEPDSFEEAKAPGMVMHGAPEADEELKAKLLRLDKWTGLPKGQVPGRINGGA